MVEVQSSIMKVYGSTPWCCYVTVVVMATLAKRKRTKASIMVFLLYRSEANTFDSKLIIFEMKRTH
jgi:hypothetical protein